MTRVRPHPHADVLVVGSGASGAIASLVLGEAGLKVVCLEQGLWTEPADHPHFSPDWEWQRVRQWSPNGNIRQHASDYPVESRSSSIGQRKGTRSAVDEWRPDRAFESLNAARHSGLREM